MILQLQDLVRMRLKVVVAELYNLSPENIAPIVIQYPPNRLLGDLAIPVAFELARTLRKPPGAIAQEIVSALGEIDGVATPEATASGYVNVYLDRARYLREALKVQTTSTDETDAKFGKAIVEHTSINPNKAAHIGHIRNAALGDTLVRLLRFRRQLVETHNYIDDTGVQVADVVVGFRRLESKTLDDVRQIAESTRFDYHCWDLYAKVTSWYEADPNRLDLRKQTLQDLERGNNESADMARFIADRIVRCHLTTMNRLNVEYDLLSWEGDILRLDFWTTAFDILKRAGAVFLQSTGTQAGCWVMEIDDDQADKDMLETSDESRLKVIVRSDDTVTYVGKDIAYQFWKFGLFDKNFHFRPYATQDSGHPLWATTSEANGSDKLGKVPGFGKAAMVYNVIDTRQSYLQRLLQQALTAVGHTREAEHSAHFSYAMVALSHKTAMALGYSTTDSSEQSFVEVSGRKGLGVKADDLLDRLTDSAATEVRARNPKLDSREVERIASMIAVCAMRYFMIKYSRGKMIVFDIDEALSFEGESGPYLQYAAVRADNILKKLEARDGTDESMVIEGLSCLTAAPLEDPHGTDLWALILEASRLDEVVDQSLRTLEPSTLAKYAFGLAQAFNAFYHRYPVLNEPDSDVKRCRAAAVIYFRTQLTRALYLMGCDVPPRM